jgi:hypothetical protein
VRREGGREGGRERERETYYGKLFFLKKNIKTKNKKPARGRGRLGLVLRHALAQFSSSYDMF